jgi:hypothetical protein
MTMFQTQSQQGFYTTQQPKYGTLYPNGRRVYKAGADFGSGFAEFWAAPEDDLDNVLHASIPSWVSLGTMADIAKRSKRIDANPLEELEEDEIVINFQGVERYAGRLGRDGGTQGTDALNDPRRYSNEHAITLLQALVGRVIPEDRVTIHLVTGLPVSLFTDENRRAVQDAFTRTFNFEWNGREKSIEVICGTVVPEGAGGLVLYGDTSSRTLIIDYGMRTTDVLVAQGQKIKAEKSKGFPLGVSHIIDAFNEEFYKLPEARRRLSEGEAIPLLYSYVHGELLPEVKSSRKVIDEQKIRKILDDVYDRLGRQSNTSIARIVSDDESGDLAAEFDLVFAMGGGAYHFKRALDNLIPNVELVQNAQSANPEGYFEIATTFSDGVWKKAVSDVANRTGRTLQHAD